MFYSFEKGKQYTRKSLCTSNLFQNRKTNIKILFQFLFFLLSFKKGKQYTRKSLCTVYLFHKSITQTQKYCINFISCCSLLKKVNSTQENLCVLCTFFKIVSDKNKNIISISFLFALLQRKISVYRLPFSKEKHSNNEIHSTNQNLCVLFTFFNRLTHNSID